MSKEVPSDQLVDAHNGINISQMYLTILDELVWPLIAKGHSPYMILQNHTEVTLSKKLSTITLRLAL